MFKNVSEVDGMIAARMICLNPFASNPDRFESRVRFALRGHRLDARRCHGMNEKGAQFGGKQFVDGDFGLIQFENISNP